MKTSPAASICIPVYNGAQYLRETILSALSQSFPDFELLIIDDGSDDESVAIISEFKCIDSRIVFLRNDKRLGLVGNWNECIKKARGKWIKFIFQDDLLEPNCLELMTDAIGRSPDKELIIFCKRDFIFESNNSGKIEENIRKSNFIWDIFPGKVKFSPMDVIKIITRRSGRNVFGEPSSFMIHRDVFDRLGLFDTALHYMCDLEYWLRAGINMQLLMVPEMLVHFRVHNQSTTSFNYREEWVQTRYLDRLLMFMKFMDDDAYIPLRKELMAWPCRIFLKTQTAIFARRARIDVKSQNNARWKKDFDDFCKERVCIGTLSNKNFLTLAVQYFLSRFCLELKWAFLHN